MADHGVKSRILGGGRRVKTNGEAEEEGVDVWKRKKREPGSSENTHGTTRTGRSWPMILTWRK